MKKFEFEPKRHRYFLDGKPMTGVTTILGVIAKPALIQWSARMAAEYVLENLKSMDDLEVVCEEAKRAHTKKKDEAAQKGTDVHALIEEIVKNAIETNSGVLTIENHENEQVQKFIDWANENDVKFLESENQVYSEKHFYAGTYDLLLEMGGRRYIGDIKTSNGIYGREFFAQMAAYRLAWEEMEKRDPIDGSIIIRIGKDGSFERKESFDYDTDAKMFLAALEIYRISNNY